MGLFNYIYLYLIEMLYYVSSYYNFNESLEDVNQRLEEWRAMIE